jgi:hypothetical protein
MIPQRVRVGRFAAAGLTVLAPVSTMAQPAPVSTTTTSTVAPRWRFQVSADGAWYENARFAESSEAGAWSTGGHASLALEQAFRRGSFSMSGYGGSIYYPEIAGFNQATYGGKLGLSWAPSTRTQVRIGQGYDRSNTRQLRSLDLEGLPLLTSGVDNATSNVSLIQGLSRRWQLGLDGTFTWRRFDNQALTGGEQLVGSIQLARNLGKDSSAYLSYGYSSSRLRDDRTRAHQALLGGRRQQEHVSWDVSGGAAYVERVGRFYPAGHAGMSVSGRRTSLSLRYSRGFGQAFGYGRETIADLVSATASWTPVRPLGFDAGYTFGYRRDPVEAVFRIRSHVATAGFRWEIAKDLGFGTHYYWERNETGGFAALEGSRVTASLSYGVSWR